ncbi:DUF1120 domain-containing protein [Pseudomonas resinovorans]|uniref:DUF1120 domain-containing protein n=1 Tax=Metapseudomonas resinovorans TaxID=53412 RepID=A0ABT4YDM8_METRE|nr:DUF1120 domain-containing protein [Pseudomonas resinovorans]MDA8486729.1 DUF1120 domain-containing protein [Pseudomonas resinovorans]
MKKLVFAPLVLAFAANTALAANSVDLRVTGTITPAACNISSTGGGNFDFGSLSAQELNATATTPWGELRNDLSITCSGATLVGIKALDNRAGTAADSQSRSFGLGLDSQGNKIGFYHITTTATPTVNGSAGSSTRSQDNGATWATNASAAITTDQNHIVSWNAAGSPDDPVPVTSVSQTIRVNVHIAPENTLDTSSDITLDGSATIELVYL